QRRHDELDNLAILTGWDVSQYGDYTARFEQYLPKEEPHYRQPKNEAPQQIEGPEKQQQVPDKRDTSYIKQGSFNAPFYSDDSDHSNPSGNLRILLISVMFLLVAF